MARRSDHTRDELKVMAIDAGQKIIIEEGFSKFSARRVAKEIGYTVGTIYNIFENHDQLILSINLKTLDDMEKFIMRCLDQNLEGRALMKHLANCYLEFAKNNYNRWVLIFEHSMTVEEILPDWYLDKIKQMFTIVEEPLRPMIKDAKKTEQSAKAIWASIHGICMLGLTGKLDIVGASSIQQLMDNLIDYYYLGISKS